MEETTQVLLTLLVMYGAAKILGNGFEYLGQPAVVGELLAGILLVLLLPGQLAIDHAFLEIFAEISVIILLFKVGLETNVMKIMQVGSTALFVAVLGVLFPFAFGIALMEWQGDGLAGSLFMGAAMVATSVGVTARVFADLGVIERREARIVLGAAVIDDILGLIVLAVVSGVVAGAGVSFSHLALIIAETVVFLGLVSLAGQRFFERHHLLFFRRPERRDALAMAVVLALGLSYLASTIGLAAIVGAFLAGMVIDLREHHEELERDVAPIYEFLVPFFFVFMGTKVDVGALTTGPAILLALITIVLAIVGKVLGGYLASRHEGPRAALTIGVAMVPRGEVGLIVAAIGLSMGAISAELYSVVVAMSIVTTLVAPPALRPLLRARDTAREASAPSP